MGKIKFGYINDGFDMFTAKDLRRIKDAKAQCEKLIVGVYSDRYYEAKNGKPPIIPCDDRRKIVNAMNGVTYTIEVDNEERLTEDQVRNLISNQEIKETQKTEKKYNVGFVQGTFDMFHTGHYNLLVRAKELCNTLIVGVNTDKLVEEYKNKKTIVPYEERMEIVDGVKLVDQVIGMSDRNKIKAARNIGFNALIMGSDWKGTEFYNIMQEELEKMGIDIVYLPYTKGISSTKLRKIINKDSNGNDIEQK